MTLLSRLVALERVQHPRLCEVFPAEVTPARLADLWGESEDQVERDLQRMQSTITQARRTLRLPQGEWSGGLVMTAVCLFHNEGLSGSTIARAEAWCELLRAQDIVVSIRRES